MSVRQGCHGSPSFPNPAPINPEIFRAYDIRGVVGQDLNSETVGRIGCAYATYMRRTQDVTRIVVARDNRPSSASLLQAFINGVRASGVHVTDIGLAPSPLLYYAAAAWAPSADGPNSDPAGPHTGNRNIGGGAVITASHSPAQMNGCKLLDRGGIPLSPSQIQDVGRLARAGDFDAPGPADRGALEHRDARSPYLDALALRFALPRPLHVVVDPGNGVATRTGPPALRRIGCTVDGINLDLDGTVPHPLPDPQDPSTMVALQQEVVRRGADFGIAWDGDGDRLGLVDEQGRRLDPDAILTLFARDLLSRHPGARVLVDVKTSLVAIRDIEAHGGVPVMGPTGHSLIKRKLRDEHFLLGGEAAAHYYFAEDWYGLDDAVYAACLVARILAAQDAPLSALFRGLPRLITSPELKLPCPDGQKFAVVGRVAGHLRTLAGDEHPLLEIDGVRADFGDGWALVRASNTGPVLSVRLEAETPARYEQIRELIWDLLRKEPSVTIPAGAGALPS